MSNMMTMGIVLRDRPLLSDSTDGDGEMLRIECFGTDSVMALWYCHPVDSPIGPGHRSVSLSLDGTPLGPSYLWTARVSADNAFSCNDDGNMSLAYSNCDSMIQVIVQQPSGNRPLDHTLVWKRSNQWLDNISGFLDHTDSLQLVWRQRSYLDTEWDAIYAKRVAINMPFDSSLLNDYIALSPELSGHFAGPVSINPIGDSLLLLQGGYFVEEMSGVCSLSVLRRDDYSRISNTLIGPLQAYPVVEGDTVVSFMTFLEDRCTHFMRYTLPNLELIQDTILVCPNSQDYGGGPLAYTLSSTGERHIIFTRTDLSMNVRYYYRYFRTDLSAQNWNLWILKEPSFSVWPNPTNSLITLIGPVQKLISIDLYNIIGQRVWHKSVKQGSEHSSLQVNLNEYSSGVYFLRLVTNDDISFQKICLLK